VGELSPHWREATKVLSEAGGSLQFGTGGSSTVWWRSQSAHSTGMRADRVRVQSVGEGAVPADELDELRRRMGQLVGLESAHDDQFR
jgi:hypothetical protein